MGGYASLPLDIKNRDEEYAVHFSISPALFFNHSTTAAQAGSPRISYVPTELSAKVSLYERVDLSFNLISELPASLPLTLPHLTHLNLSFNRVSSLPHSIFGFIHLKELDVSHNQLTSLPDSLVTLRRLARLDLSHNQICVLPTTLDSLHSLEKLDLSNNKLQHLPICLGNLGKLRVLLVEKNEFGAELRDLVGLGSPRLLDHLRACYKESQRGDVLVQANIFRRERGAVFDSKILNSGSAESFFTQIQTQAVNTGNRILTPLIPPPGSTTLGTEAIKDKLLGMFYGCMVGDSLGVFTQSLTPTQVEFYYEKERLVEQRLHIDEFRCHYTRGEVSLASQIVYVVLDSVLEWGGVVDELDYAKRLYTVLLRSDKPLTSPVLQGISAKSNFKSEPQCAAREWMEDSSNQTPVCDNFCLPPMIGLVISQFQDLLEVVRNSTRICSSTHSDPGNLHAAQLLAKCLAKLLQGKKLTQAMEDIEVCLSSKNKTVEEGSEASNNNLLELTHPLTTLKQLAECAKIYKEKGFEEALLQVIFKGGDSCVAGCVVGAVLGLDTGFSLLPPHWISNLDPHIRSVFDRKVNTLFDVMGIP